MSAVLVIIIASIGVLTTPVAAEPTATGRPADGRQGSEVFEQVGTVAGAPFALANSPHNLFTPNGRFFLVEDPHDDSVTLYDARALKPVTGPLEHAGLDTFSVTRDAKTVFTTGGGEVRLWDVTMSKTRATLKADKTKLSFFNSSADGRRFLTISGDSKTLAVWNVKAKGPEKAYELFYSYCLNSARFDPSGTYLVASEFGGNDFDLIRAEADRLVCPEIQTHAFNDLSSATDLAQFDPTGRHLAVPLKAGFRLLESATGKLVAEAHWDTDLEAQSISFSPDGSLVAVTTRSTQANGPVYVFDAATAHRLHQLGTNVLSCQLSPGGRFALCNHAGANRPELWDLRSGAVVERFPSMDEVGGAGLLSPDGQTILVGIRPDTIAIWRLRTMNPTSRPREKAQDN